MNDLTARDKEILAALVRCKGVTKLMARELECEPDSLRVMLCRSGKKIGESTRVGMALYWERANR